MIDEADAVFAVPGIGALRPLSEADLEQVRAWRNHPGVREAMYTRHVIGADEHAAWWARVKAGRAERHYVFTAEGGGRGVVSFRRIDPEARSAEWGFYAAPDAPRGTGARMHVAALDQAFGPMGLAVVFAEVIETNARSLAAHRRRGFELIARAMREVEGHGPAPVVRFALTEQGWRRARTAQIAEIDRRRRPHD